MGGGAAAAVTRLLEDRASPSHLLITVIPETQPANNRSARLHGARADGGRGSGSRRHSQPEQTGLNWAFLDHLGLYEKAHLLYFHNGEGRATPCSESRMICESIRQHRGLRILELGGSIVTEPAARWVLWPLLCVQQNQALALGLLVRGVTADAASALQIAARRCKYARL